MRRAALALVLLALLAAAPALPAVASGGPLPVCGPCGGGLEQAARGADFEDLDVTSSTAVVRIHEDGSATWHVTNRLGNETAAVYLRENPEALDRIVRASLKYTAVDADFRAVDASIDGPIIEVTFEDPDAARRMHGGVLVNEYFHSRGYDTGPALTADRVTVVGPPRTTVTNDPAGADVDGRNATWHGDATVGVSRAPGVDGDAYVAYGDRSGVSRLWTRIDIGLLTASIVWDVVSTMFLAPLFLFGLLLVIAVRIGRIEFSPTDASVGRVSRAVAGLGGVLVVGAVVLDAGGSFAWARWVGGLGAVYLSLAGVTYWRGDEVRPRDLAVVGLLVVVVVPPALSILRPGGLPTWSTPARVGLTEIARLLPIVVAPLVGAAAVRGGHRDTVLAGVAILGAFFALQLSIVWPTQRPFGLVTVVFFAAAVVVVVGVLPPIVLGATVVRTGGPAMDEGRTSRSA